MSTRNVMLIQADHAVGMNEARGLMRKVLVHWPAIVPLIILAMHALALRWLDNLYATDGRSLQYRAVIVIFIFTIIVPLICLTIEVIGLVRAIKANKNLTEDEPYSVRRRSIHLVFLYIGEILLTLLLLVTSIYIVVQLF